jgi:hypothetical protein
MQRSASDMVSKIKQEDENFALEAHWFVGFFLRTLFLSSLMAVVIAMSSLGFIR